MMSFAILGSCLLATSHSLELAYVGPGGGLSAIGALLAIVAGLAAAVFGFIWYPLKRMLRKKGESAATNRDGSST